MSTNNKPRTSTNASITPAKVRRIRKLLTTTAIPQTEIARKVGCSRHVVYRILSGQNYNWVA